MHDQANPSQLPLRDSMTGSQQDTGAEREVLPAEESECWSGLVL
jgi:hypothetical protein